MRTRYSAEPVLGTMDQEDQSRKGRLILMPHSHLSCLVHLVFSTSGQQPTQSGNRCGIDCMLSWAGSRSEAWRITFTCCFAEYRSHRKGCSIVENRAPRSGSTRISRNHEGLPGSKGYGAFSVSI